MLKATLRIFQRVIVGTRIVKEMYQENAIATAEIIKTEKKKKTEKLVVNMGRERTVVIETGIEISLKIEKEGTRIEIGIDVTIVMDAMIPIMEVVIEESAVTQLRPMIIVQGTVIEGIVIGTEIVIATKIVRETRIEIETVAGIVVGIATVKEIGIGTEENMVQVAIAGKIVKETGLRIEIEKRTGIRTEIGIAVVIGTSIIVDKRSGHYSISEILIFVTIVV